MQKKLIDHIREAEKNKIALGHFNISNSETLTGIFNAAKSLNLPVIIGVSQGERDFIGVRQAIALVKSFRDQYDFPIYINADHTYDMDRAREAIDSGFDAIVIDGTHLTFEENIRMTKECVEYARRNNPEILVEAEIGYIGESSKMLDELPESVKEGLATLPTPEDAKRMVEETGIDLLAPAVGNVHGMLKGVHNPKLNIELIREMKEAVSVPLVLHGGSGITDEDFTEAIEAGISLVHVNTEIRVAFKDALKMYLQENPDEIAPYRILKDSVKAVEKKTTERMSLFARLN
jgi:fructose-bisphosphate aldolase, class II